MYSNYHKAICEEMITFSKMEKVIFLGQQTKSEDFYNTLKEIPLNLRYEMPVAEELQMGVSIGLAMEGYLPISIYQRIDFLPRAMDQLVNHLNIIKKMSRGMYNPKVIIRTTIGTNKPFDVGLQHNKDLTELFKVALDFPVFKVTTPEEVRVAYNVARIQDTSVLIIEDQELYYD